MLCVEPILLLVTIYLSLVYGVLYARAFLPHLLTFPPNNWVLSTVFEALPIIFVGTRHFSIGESGLIFIGVGIGTTLGAALFFPMTAHYPQLMVKWRGFPPPEQRLFGAMIGGVSLVLGCFWLGWTGNYASVPWYVPALATIPIGFSVSMVFISFFVSPFPLRLSAMADGWLERRTLWTPTLVILRPPSPRAPWCVPP